MHRWVRHPAQLVGAGFVLVCVVVLVALAAGPPAGFLDPRAVDRAGSRAVAEVLRAQGVQVELVETTAAALAAADPGATVLVALPDRLVEAQVDRLRELRADLVLIAPTRAALAIVPGLSASGPAPDLSDRGPDCPLPAAGRAGELAAGGLDYRFRSAAPPGTLRCYPAADGEDAALVRVEANGRTVTVLGTADPLMNQHLGEEGNAALALGLLGVDPRLVWYLPSPADVPVGGDTSPLSLLPPPVRAAGAMLAVAAVLAALWRARRLGPVVSEPLPVVVRAAETVEGRARLYRRARAVDRAAEALRAATCERLRRPLALPRAVDPMTLVAAAAARTGRPEPEVADLLVGPVPADDAALLRLALALDALERQVREPGPAGADRARPEGTPVADP